MNSELAFNLNGEPFDVPVNAAGWRVRRMKNKGAPEVVYGRNGLPLVLPIDAELDDVRAETGAPGRYRLDPVDEANRPIVNAPAGYVYVHEQRAQPTADRAPVPTTSDSIVIEAMRMNAELARSVVDRFPQMVEAAANLLRAADGAGLPARQPRAIDDDEDEDGDVAPAKGFDLTALLPLAAALFSGGKMPDLASMLDWRKAAMTGAPAKKQAKLPSATAAVVEAPQPNDDEATSHEQPPALDPDAMAHFVAIQSQLAPDESAIAREVASTLSATEMHAWIEELRAMNVADAVKKIRKLVSGNKEKVL